MKQGALGFVAIALALVAGCGDNTDVCAAQRDAAAACEWLAGPLASCDENLDACSDDDRGRWVERFDCMRSHCDAGEPQLVVEQTCGADFDVAWGCSPGGGI